MSTSSTLLLVNAVLDAVVFLIDVLVAPDLAEHTASLLRQPALDQPAGALGQEQEADKLENCREHRKTQHVSASGGRKPNC